MDTLFNLEVLRSVYVFKDLNNAVKDVSTSLEKTTKGIQSLSDSFSSFTRSSIEKVKELSSEFRELTKSITQPQVAALSFDTSGAMNEFSKISSMAQGLSEMSYKETITESGKISRPDSSGDTEKDTDQPESLFDKIIEVINKLGEASESIGKILDLMERLTGKGKDKEASPDSGGGMAKLLPAIGEGINGLIRKALPRLRVVFTAIRTGLSSVMTALGRVGAALLAIPGLGEILLVVAAVIALVIAIKELWEHSRRFREMIGYIEGAGKAVFHNIGLYATRFWKLVIKPLVKGIAEAFNEAFLFIQTIVSAAWSVMVLAFDVAIASLKMTWSGFVLAFETAFAVITGTAEMAWNGIVLGFTTAVAALKAIWDGLLTGLTIAFGIIKNTVKAVWTGMVSGFNSVVSGLRMAWNTIINGFKVAFSTVLSAVKAVWNGIVSGFSYVMLGLKTAWNVIVSGFRNAFSSVLAVVRGIWSGITAVFRSIGSVIRTIGNAVMTGFRAVFSFVTRLIQSIWNGIVSVFNTVWGFIVSVFQSVISVFKMIWNTIISVFKSVWNLIVGVWSGLMNIFSKFRAWIYDSILNPIIETFIGIWNWIVKLFDKIVDRITGVVSTIKNVLKKIFSSEGTMDVDASGKAQANVRGKEFDAEQEKKRKEAAARKEKNESDKAGNESVFDLFSTTKTRELSMKNFGASALTNVQSRNSSFGGSMGSGAGAGGGQKSVGNLNITKLIENMNIYNQNNTMSKEAIIQMVREALLTAVADFTLAQKDNY